MIQMADKHILHGKLKVTSFEISSAIDGMKIILKWPSIYIQ